MKEWKKLYKSMSMDEKKALVMLWKKTTLTRLSAHCAENMTRRDVTKEMIEDAWRVNQFVEFKVKNGRPRLVVRGLHVYTCKYDYSSNGVKKLSSRKEPCNVCLVVDMIDGNIVTCYTSPVRLKDSYINSTQHDSNYDYEKDVRDYL